MAESTTRVEAFSDGGFAIASTLLILEIRLPEPGAPGGDTALWIRLAALWLLWIRLGYRSTHAAAEALDAVPETAA